MHEKHKKSKCLGVMDVFHEDGMKLVGDRLMECVTVSDQTNCQHLEMYKEGAGKVDRVVVAVWMK